MDTLAAVIPFKRTVRTYQLKVTLADVAPAVWRVIEVPAAMKFARLHHVLQAVMGWGNSYLHEFKVGGRRFGIPEHWDGDPDIEDERDFRLSDIAPGAGSGFRYVYDMGTRCGWSGTASAPRASRRSLTAAARVHRKTVAAPAGSNSSRQR